jgi:hypothetical protein
MLSQAMIAGYGYAAHETAEVSLRAKANIDDLTDEQVEILLVKNLEISRGQQARCWELRAACDLASLRQSKGRRRPIASPLEVCGRRPSEPAPLSLIGPASAFPIAEVAVVELTMASYGHVPTLDEAKAAFTLVLILMKCIATHFDFDLSRLSTPANLLVFLQRYIPT